MVLGLRWYLPSCMVLALNLLLDRLRHKLEPHAISTMDAAHLPHGIVADTNWVHLIAEPGAGTYARRPAPLWSEFTAFERRTNRVILKWSGQ